MRMHCSICILLCVCMPPVACTYMHAHMHVHVHDVVVATRSSTAAPQRDVLMPMHNNTHMHMEQCMLI